MTLACEDDNSKLVDVVTVAGEVCVGNNLLQILKLRFGQKTFVQTLSTRFGQDFEVKASFEAGVWSVFFQRRKSFSPYKSCLNFNFKVLTFKPCAQSLNKSLSL